MVQLFMIECVPFADTKWWVRSNSHSEEFHLRHSSTAVPSGSHRGGYEGKKVEQCDPESWREFATTCSQLQRYELNMRNVNLSMCGHGAVFFFSQAVVIWITRPCGSARAHSAYQAWLEVTSSDTMMAMRDIPRPPTKPHVTHRHLVFSQQASGM